MGASIASHEHARNPHAHAHSASCLGLGLDPSCPVHGVPEYVNPKRWVEQLPVPVPTSLPSVADEYETVRSLIASMLMMKGKVPVLVLVELILRYALPIPLTVSTVNGAPVDSWMASSSSIAVRGCVLWRPPPPEPASTSPFVRAAARDLVLLVTDHTNQNIKEVNLSNHDIRVFASMDRKDWFYPNGICVVPSDNTLLVTGYAGVKRVSCTGVVKHLAGDPSDRRDCRHWDGFGEHARFSNPLGIAATLDGRIAVVADSGTHRVRAIDLKTTEVTTLAGNGIKATDDDMQALYASIDTPNSVAFGGPAALGLDSVLFIASADSIRRYDMKSGSISTLRVGADRFLPRALTFYPPNKLLVGTNETLYVLNVDNGALHWFAGNGCGTGYADGPALAAKFHNPTELVLVPKRAADDATGMDRLYVADSWNHHLRLVSGTIYGLL